VAGVHVVVGGVSTALTVIVTGIPSVGDFLRSSERRSYRPSLAQALG
jgi:hypothetical protein